MRRGIGMEDTTDNLIEKIVVASNSLGIDWPDYGPPGVDEYRVVLDSTLEYLKTLEGSVAMDLPNIGIKVDRDDDGRYNVYLKVGSLSQENS